MRSAATAGAEPPAQDGALIVAAAADAAGIELSLVIPTLEERENLVAFAAAVRAVLDASGRRYEVIVVDDDSADQTWRVAEEMTAAWPALRVVRRRGERGLARAVVCGWQVARGDILGTINADFQHPPAVLTALLAAIDGADLAVASRYAPGGSVGAWSPWRRLATRLARTAGRLVLPGVFARVADPLSGCYLVRRAAIAGVELRPLGYKTLLEVLARGRVRTLRECPYAFAPRRRGRSKAGGGSALGFLAQLARLHRDRGMPN